MAENTGSGKPSRRALEPGTVLNNNYRILERIGEGGMGAVYRAANIFMEEDHVAIKVIRAEQADDDLFKQMFGKEVKAMLRLNNPRLVAYRTFAHDPELDLSFIVTEFIDGPSLKSLIGKRQFSPQELLSLMSELAIGLRAAHQQGIVHRDMAPDNVLLEDGDFDRPKIIDFGIVKDTAGDGTTIIGTGFAGKYNFVAPEQLGEPDHPIGPWTDIFSLALVIVGLARGKSIDMGNTPGAAIRMRRELPDLSSIPQPMRPLLADMLATHPNDRIQSAEEVLKRVGPIFAELEDWSPEGDGETDKTVVMSPITAPTGDPEPDDSEDEITEVVFEDQANSASSFMQDAAPEDTSNETVDETGEDEEAYTQDQDAQTSGRSKALVIFLGLIGAGTLAVVGGMLLGEYAGVPGGPGPDPDDRPSAAPSSPTPTPTETEPIAPPQAILPQVAISTSLAPDVARVPISPETWVRQQDLPRQMYGSEPVRGVIAAYVTVSRGGAVTGCTIGASTQVDPQRMLNASGTSICRALQNNARFEPLPDPLPEPLPSPDATASAIDEAEQAVEAVEFRQDIANPQPTPSATGTLAPPPQETQVFVRVAFRTIDPEPETAPEE